MKDTAPYKILFVCLGNICRSPMAETIVNRMAQTEGLPVEADSAGISSYHCGEPSDLRMRSAARRRGYEITHRSRPVTRSDFERFDIIIGMDDSNLDSLMRMAATEDEERKVIGIGRYIEGTGYDYVPDPYYGGADGFNMVINLLETAAQNIINDLRKNRWQ